MRLSRRFIKPVFILLVVLILLIFLHYIRLLPPVEGLVQRILSPVQHQLYVIGTTINSFYRYAEPADDLVGANEALQSQVDSLRVENAQLKTLLLEKQEADEQINFLQAEGLEAVIAKVIGRSLQPDVQTLIINKGIADGITLDAPVVAQQGILIGQIAAVNNHSAHVRLINDSQNSLGAMVQNAEFSKGVVNGDRGLSLKMELIPQGETVIEGDIVVTSGIESSMPRGLVIGQIEQVNAEPNSLFQEAFVKSLVDFNNLVVVSVLRYQHND